MKVITTEALIRDALRLDDAEGIECLPNEEIFTELARIGYENPSTKLTFYKVFFLPQWKFLIYTILQCMSAKQTSWNEFSSSMASAVICLSTSRKFNFSKYIFDSLVRNVDSSAKFYMYPRFLQLIIRAQVGDLSSHTTKYSSLTLTQKDARIFMDLLRNLLDTCTTLTRRVENLEYDKVAQALEITKLKQRVKKLERKNKPKGRMIADMDANVDVTLKDIAKDVALDAEIKESADVQGRGMSYDDIRLIFEKKFNSNVAFLLKTKEQMDDEDSRALKRLSESQKDKAAKKQKLDEEVKELKKHLMIVPNDDDDVYTEATFLALKVLVVDYEIYTENNKPYYKIKRAYARYTSSNLEKSKKCSWLSEGQELEAVRVLWCAYYHIYYNTVGFASREEITTYKVHSGLDAQ
nr:synaptobrevin, longin-like domain protein [Tanacetum cinerariifolium]